MARVPVIRVGDTLIVTVQEDLRDRDALDLQTDLWEALERTGAQGVLLDVSVVEMVDSFLGRLLAEVATGAKLLGAQTVVVGIQPAVAITLVELGLDLKGVHTALDTERGMALIRRLVERERAILTGGQRQSRTVDDRPAVTTHRAPAVHRGFTSRDGER